MKRISVMVVLAAVLGVLLSASVALAAPDIRGCSGQNSSVETCGTGQPDYPNGFGAVTSQRASTTHDIGDHVSSQDTPHKGVGNVARTDGNLVPLIGGNASDTGARPGDHGCLIGQLDNSFGADPQNVTDCTQDPGLPGHPGGQS